MSKSRLLFCNANTLDGIFHGVDVFQNLYNIINVEWVDLFSEIATEITEEQISDAVTAIENARHALEANAVPQLTLEVMMLDLPWADPAKIPSLDLELGDGR